MTDSEATQLTLASPVQKRSPGFTLIEILVALAIVAVLSTIAFPVYKGYIDKAKVTVSLNTLEATRKTIEDYHISYESYPLDIDFNTGLDSLGNIVLPAMLLDDFKKNISSVDSYTAIASDYTLTVRAIDSKHTILTLTPGQIITQGP
jgi:prepilin-type N-terminal cleavage/methylation domain-containing protein